MNLNVMQKKCSTKDTNVKNFLKFGFKLLLVVHLNVRIYCFLLSTCFNVAMAAGPIAERNQDATIYVGGLDEKVSETLLWELFLEAGPVG